MKTPDEIKKGLRCCQNPDGNPTICEECPYKDTKGSCIDRLYLEARKCIQQLEASYSQVSKSLCGKENATLEEVLQAASQVKAELATVKRERDAMERDFKGFANCEHNICFYCASDSESVCGKCLWQLPEKFTWRGFCPENTEVQDG